MFAIDGARLIPTCGLCLRIEGIIHESSTYKQCFETSFSAMLDIFNLPANFVVPTSVCEECLKHMQSAYNFYQSVLQSIGNTLTTPKAADETPLAIPDILAEVNYPCDLCALNFDTTYSLKRHRKIAHFGITSQHSCLLCHKNFKTIRGLQQHLTYCPKTNLQQYRCEQCSQTFNTKTSYTNHLLCHVDFICRFCDHGWMNENKLLEHVRNYHQNRLFVCKRCSKTETLRKLLNRHLKVAHDVQQHEYYCGYCSNDESFNDANALNEHFQKQHKSLNDNNGDYEELLKENFFEKDLTLELMPEQSGLENVKEDFLKSLNLIRIVEKASHSFNIKDNFPSQNKMILEEFLDEAFENDQIWTKYIEGGEEYLIDNYDFYLEGQPKENTVKYKCPKCSEGFVKQSLLTRHLAEAHDVSCLVCNDCGANFNKLLEYRNHRQEHLIDNARFVENIIPEAEEALSLVQKEEKEYIVYDKGSSYVYTCKLCECTFAKKSNLAKHNCSFLNETPAPEKRSEATIIQVQSSDLTIPDSLFCTLCDKKFSSISGLKYHLKRHTDVKSFACIYCNKKFTASSNLNAHIRQKHSENKGHPCLECDQSFACKDHLMKHIRSKHRQERSFACPECPKRYFQKSHLNDHVAASHMGYKAFVCDICSTSYGCRGSLRRHVAKNHTNQIK